MDELEKVKSFLESMTYEKEGLDLKKGRYPFITISRQTGAGGHTLSKAILREIEKEADPLFQGWHVFDDELCEMVCEEPGLKVTITNLLSSEYHSEIEDRMNELIVGDSPQDAVLKRIFRNIRTLASFGKVILVGRGGVCLTRSLPSGIHLHLVAPLRSRIKRMMELYNLPEKKAKETVCEQDQGRERLVKNFFNQKVNDPLLYDMTFNTSIVPMEDIARITVALIKTKMGCAAIRK